MTWLHCNKYKRTGRGEAAGSLIHLIAQNLYFVQLLILNRYLPCNVFALKCAENALTFFVFYSIMINDLPQPAAGIYLKEGI